MSKSSYKVMKQIALGVIVSCGLSGVSHAQSNSTTEMYYIFDIKTTASAQEVGSAIAKGIKRHAPKMNSNFPLVMEPSPVEPKRFEIVDMSESFSQRPGIGGLLALAQASGQGGHFKTAKCDGAVWIGKFTRDIANQTLSMSTCLFPYQGGFSLNVYGQDTHKKGRGGLSGLIGQAVAEGVIGKPQKWTRNTFKNMRKKLYEKVGVLAVLEEGQPRLDFTFKDEPMGDALAADGQKTEAVTAVSTNPVVAAQAPSVAPPSAPAASQIIVAPAPVPAPAAPSIDCSNLTDDECFAKVRAATQ